MLSGGGESEQPKHDSAFYFNISPWTNTVTPSSRQVMRLNCVTLSTEVFLVFHTNLFQLISDKSSEMGVGECVIGVI